ncbi:MAG: hypothetical protein ABUL46_01575 [Chitinophaga rupis]
MMERRQHTDPWADKLQEVQLPDVNDSWNAMATILDKEMPVARQQARRRWLLLVILLLLLIGVCNCPRLGHRYQSPGAGPSTTSPSTTGQPAPGSSISGHSTPRIPDLPASTTGRETEAIPDSATAAEQMTPGTPAFRDPAREASPPATLTSADSTPAASAQGKPASPSRAPGHRVSSRRSSKSGRPVIAGASVSADTGEITSSDNQPSGKPGKGNSKTTGNMRSESAGNQRSGTVDSQGSGNRDKKTPATSGLKATEPTDQGAKKTTDPTAKKPGPAGKKPGDPVAQKSTEQPDKKKTDKVKPTEEDDVKGLVAGIGLNQFFSVGQQQKSDYNSGGTSGGIGDYIPVPMVRYYFNRKLYVQLEAQFNTPQYTKKDLVGGLSKADTLSPGRVEQNSVIIKKLFYFNLPLSLHYSPFKNLYLGAGLQYSRLTNGVGVLQNKVIVTGAADSIKSAVVYNIKGDSVYQKMRTNEFRVLFDINYTYKKFILGVRYNQALSKFLDVRISDTQITQARNSSLQLYARYILWDHRKKKPSPSK